MDRIERQVDIAAPAQRVWELISRPGWFINDGTIVDHETEDLGDGLHRVHVRPFGDFQVRTLTLDPPRYAAFRWLSGKGENAGEDGSTLVEFRIEEHADSGVSLHVTESGFSTLSVSESERRRKVEENTAGWEEELGLARVLLESPTNGGQ
ncbi:SRPBCC domain-containing protein [Spiractinospora alimapuensis]|nr:SRPBCC domain-containing protein [Spiractinospora alimapuensis]